MKIAKSTEEGTPRINVRNSGEAPGCRAIWFVPREWELALNRAESVARLSAQGAVLQRQGV